MIYLEWIATALFIIGEIMIYLEFITTALFLITGYNFVSKLEGK
jgi:hypothetical protein